MVNIKNILALGLIAVTASAATIGHEKRHIHHRRHAKKPCTTGAVAPFPVGNATQPAGTGVATSTPIEVSSSRPVITLSVIPVPVSPPAGNPTGAPVPTDAAPSAAPPVAPGQPSAPSPPVPSGPSEPGKPSAPVCQVATSYVTVQQTVTVTAAEKGPTAPAPVAPPAPSSPVAAPSNPPPPPPAAASPAPAPPVAAPAPSSPAEAPSNPPPPPPAAVAPEVPAPSTPAPAPSTPATAPSTPAPGNVYTGAKQGISWDPNQDFTFSSLDINTPPTWVYDWGQKANGVPTNLEYIPTLHREEKCAGFANDLKGSGATWVKHFNEPDMVGNGGSGLSPARAADLHNQYIAQLTGSYNFGLPAVTSHNVDGSSGTGWLKSFVSIVGCKQFKFADFHFYGGGEGAATQAKIFLDYVSDWQSTIDQICPGQNLPIWVTEFAATPLGNPKLAADFMAIAGPSLDSNARVARYAYFVQNNNLIKETLTEIAGAVKAAAH